jgi:hypothetical protein
MKSAVQELLEYVEIREESISDLDIMFIKAKIKELLNKEKEQIENAYLAGLRSDCPSGYGGSHAEYYYTETYCK